MKNYNLKIKYKDSGLWNTSVFAENDDEAVEKSKTYDWAETTKNN